ncbi:MAG TPA: DinB family protein [Candidatus Dormibacteraeota bacterium]|nr:DinB family protein [Candidatus Dormibacteraeota bacterium]
MSDFLVQALRYNRWANLQLLDVCSSLSDEQLELSSPGTYGTISATWLHIVGAEERYLRRLVDFQPRLEGGSFPGIAALKQHAADTGDALIAAAATVDPDGTSTARDEWAPKHWLVMVQAIHHGNDHRTHICTILGQNGIDYGGLDVWAFGDSNDGYVKC